MMSKWLPAAALAAVVALALPAASASAQAIARRTAAAKSHVAPPTDSWPTNGGPTLQALRNNAVVLQTVSEGRKEMPAFGGTLTADQIRDVAAYVTQKLATPAP
jgi:mono/diheme cytochrome c family protein